MSDVQLPLAFRVDAWHRFEHFYRGKNGLIVAQLRALVEACKGSNQSSEALDEMDGDAQNVNHDFVAKKITTQGPGVFLHGMHDSGKTHLLLAACAELGPSQAIYLPLQSLGQDPEDVLQHLSPPALVCLDELSGEALNARAQQALFDLFNRIHDQGSQLIVAAHKPLALLGLQLPDLVSRLASLVQVEILPLEEFERREVLRDAARKRGLILDATVVDFLFKTQSRSLKNLLGLLERLDRESLAQHRKITIPFLKKTL